MATSGVSAWSLTARDIITAALQELAVLAIGDEPTAGEAEACMMRLNALRKSWQGGAPFDQTATITLLAGVGTALMADDVQDITAVRLTTAPDIERPLFDFGRDDYQALPNKTQTGVPTGYATFERVDGTYLSVWPVPTVDTEATIDYQRKPETVTDLGQTVDIPERFQEAIVANLALRCAGLFGAQPTQELVMRAQRLEGEMLDAQRPRSYHLGMDC